MHRTRPLLIALLIAPTLGACGSTATPPSTGTPPPTVAATPRPTPTPIAVEVSTPAQAAALVIALDPRFAGAQQLDPNVIGASKWWEATPLSDGGYQIALTIGWGDCPAGCIERHVWEYEVTPAGQVELIAEHGDEVPSDLPG